MLYFGVSCGEVDKELVYEGVVKNFVWDVLQWRLGDQYGFVFGWRVVKVWEFSLLVEFEVGGVLKCVFGGVVFNQFSFIFGVIYIVGLQVLEVLYLFLNGDFLILCGCFKVISSQFFRGE